MSKLRPQRKPSSPVCQTPHRHRGTESGYLPDLLSEIIPNNSNNYYRPGELDNARLVNTGSLQ